MSRSNSGNPTVGGGRFEGRFCHLARLRSGEQMSARWVGSRANRNVVAREEACAPGFAPSGQGRKRGHKNPGRCRWADAWLHLRRADRGYKNPDEQNDCSMDRATGSNMLNGGGGRIYDVDLCHFSSCRMQESGYFMSLSLPQPRLFAFQRVKRGSN
jgi:hypothetical protein